MNTPVQERQSLLRRAVLSNLLLVGLSAVLLMALYAELQRTALEQQLRLRAETVADFLATQSEFGMLVSDYAGLQQVAASALSVDDVLFVELRDQSGQSIASVFRPDVPARSIPHPGERASGNDKSSEVRRSMDGGTSFLELSRVISGPAPGGVVEWESRKRPTLRLGTIRMGFSMQRQQRLLQSTIGYGTAILAASLLMIFGVQHIQLRRLLEPLHGLIAFAGQVGRGDLKLRAPVVRPDEIGRLAVAFNQMVDELGSTTVSKNYVSNILQSMAEAVIVVDEERRIRTVNQAALALLGYSEQELAGQPAALILPSDDSLVLPVSGMERVYRLRDGREIPVLFSGAALPEAAGGEVWLAQDISERKRKEEELKTAKQEAESASRAKSDLLSRTSHELRTPLNAILGFAQLLEMDPLDEVQRGNLAQILKAGQHLLRLINEVLEIASVESGRRTLSLEPVNLSDAARESLDLVQPVAANRNVELHIDTSVCATGYVMADRQRLQQVLLNLLSNAVKYNRPGGHVFLDSEQRPAGFLRIRVRDTGPGIPPEGLAKLFVPFERLGAEQIGIEGTGLGLTFAKSFVESMGGSIGISSIVGEGTTLWIDLPQSECPVAALRLPDDVLPPLPLTGTRSSQRLLYIEDNPSNRELIARVLTHRPSIELILAVCGEDGIAAARRERPDLILLDVHLPDIWGDEVLRRLKANPVTASIPVIVLSADATREQIQRLITLGANAYLTKPIDVRELIRTLDQRLIEMPENALV